MNLEMCLLGNLFWGNFSVYIIYLFLVEKETKIVGIPTHVIFHSLQRLQPFMLSQTSQNIYIISKS